ncbi:MAG: hypothetical protein LUD51_07810, partial [Clostridia bacterium]|nr:hypothetical protein [Clostridia bacterium]
EGDSQTVTITVDKEQFKSYDSNCAETYIVDPGNYYITAASDSHDAINNILAAKIDDGIIDSSCANKMYAIGNKDATGNKDLVGKVEVPIETDNNNVKTDLSGNSVNLTYSTSSETGAAITNQLDSADINRYSGSGSNSVTYVSRNNWTGTWPSAAVTLSIATTQMQTDLHSDNELEEDGSAMPTYGASNNITLAMLRGKDYVDEDWDKLLDQMTYAEQALLICDGYHLTNAVSSVAKPATVDENGPTSVTGSVTGCCMPSEGIWAASFNDELLERIGNLMGDDCIMAGVQGLYAPGVNIHRTPFCGRAHEYFSEDPYLSGMASVAEVKGIQERGVVAYVKHFAFNECETNRNGVGVWLNEQEAREIYLLPFEYSMRPSIGNAHAIMTSFNRVGCVWSSACSGIMINIARDEWDFDGFSITDASSGNGGTYMTFYDGIMNGTCLYDGTGTSADLDDYASSARFCNMMRDASHRILYVVCNFSAAMNGISSSTTIVSVTPWWQALLIALEVIGIVLVVGSAACYVVAEVFKHKKSSDSTGTDAGASGDSPDSKS